jgi:putative oxidoreductase
MLEHLVAPYSSWGLLVLRLGVAAVFFAHGWPKLNPRGPMKGPAGFAGWLEQLHVPLAPALAWVVALLETAGAGLLALGLGTRLLAVGFGIDMVVAISVALRPMGASFTSMEPGASAWELEFLLLVSSLAMVFTGAGAISLDRLLGF